VLGLAVIERIRIKQRARVNWMRAGDANTKFFHVKASSRRRKNFIATIAGEGEIATEHQHKANMIKAFFDTLIGSAPSPTTAIDWPALQLPQLDLSELDAPFSADEVRQAIADIPADRAPGPDGFSGGFFKAAVNIILPDLLSALNRNGLARINAAHLVLIPKSEGQLRCGITARSASSTGSSRSS
jgi:hypothetical protein